MNDNVKSAARVLDILELLFRSEEPMALKDLVSILALPKSSAHALLRTLQSRGYVERDAADRYALNESLRQSSGWIGGPEAHLAAVARPVMDQLRDDLDETVFLESARRAATSKSSPSRSVARRSATIPTIPACARPTAPGWEEFCWHSGTRNRQMPI
jgi:DNA-binding IclR family transcriptional regulator